MLLDRIPKFVVPLLIPAFVLLAAYFTVPELARVPTSLQRGLVLLPLGVAVLGALLSLRFRRSRVLFLLLLIASSYAAAHRLLPWLPSALGPLGARDLALFALPLNVAVLASLRERGIATRYGALRLAVLLLQVPAWIWLWQLGAGVAAPWLDRLRLPPVLDILPGPLGAPSLAASIFALAVLAWRLIRRPSPIDAGMLGALLAMQWSLARLQSASVSAVLALAAVLCLGLSLLQDSYDLAYRDELTGLPARRALLQALDSLGRRYCVAMVDVDHFKRFNDNYGHDVGDQVLRMVAAQLERHAGPGRPYRYGGEEFTVLFPRRSLASVLPIAEQMRARIADYALALRAKDRPARREGRRKRGAAARAGAQTVSVTVSIGLAERSPRLRVPAEVVKAADRALYRAKRKGRNRVSR